MFVDNVQVVERLNVEYRTVTTLDIDGFMFSTFFGGSSSDWQASKREKASFKNFNVFQQEYTTFENDQRVVLELGTCGNENWGGWISRDSGGLAGSGEYEMLSHLFDDDGDGDELLKPLVGCGLEEITGIQARRKNQFSVDEPFFDTARLKTFCLAGRISAFWKFLLFGNFDFLKFFDFFAKKNSK